MLSDVRSGSTLLAQLLGAHSQIISAGELQWLRAYALNDRRMYDPPHGLVCACGASFHDCEFWRSVCGSVGRPVSGLRVMPRFFRWYDPDNAGPAYRRLPSRFIRRFAALSRLRAVQAIYGGNRIARDNMTVFDAIALCTKARHIVDSSKNVLRARLLAEWFPKRVRLLVLYRDYRAVIHSKMKRGESLEGSAHSWVVKMREIESLARDVPPSMLIKLRYEDLCMNPATELTRVCRFLGVAFEPQMLRRSAAVNHDLGGSTSKFEPGNREIQLDSGYLRELSSAQLDRMRAIVGTTAANCGYD
jgi:hypothetical protein